MNIKKVIPALLFYFLFSNLYAQNGFNFDDIIKWSNGGKANEANNSLFDSNAYYRLTTLWTGEDQSLDIVRDDKKTQPILSKTNNTDGQYWKITKVDNESYTLTTKWQGINKRLDCVEGPNQKRPVLTNNKNLSTTWKITPINNDYYHITNMLLKDQSLDIINDGDNNKIATTKTANYKGQYWKITKIEL